MSGLSTNIGLLDSGISWAYVVAAIVIAFVGKIVGGTIAARLCKMVWRESFTIGVLMSCKGLVELIVLNIGLEAKILSTRTFTIFVIMALVTTFATTPLTIALYPPWYQEKLAAWKRGEIDWDGSTLGQDGQYNISDRRDVKESRELLIHVRLESLSSIFAIISILGGGRLESPIGSVRSKRATASDGHRDEPRPLFGHQPLRVHGLRMLELTKRLSSVMKGSELKNVPNQDPVIRLFRSFGQLNDLSTSGDVKLVPEGLYARTLADCALELKTSMVLLPWSESGSLSETVTSPIEHARHKAYTTFLTSFLDKAPCHAAVFIEDIHKFPTTTLSPCAYHVLCPFFGGADDRTALQFVLQLARNPKVTATILLIELNQEVGRQTDRNGAGEAASAEQLDRNFYSTMKDSLSLDLEARVKFDTVTAAQPLHAILARVQSEVGQAPENSGDLIVLGRNHGLETKFKDEIPLLSNDQPNNADLTVQKSLGDVAHLFIATAIKASLLVIQAKMSNRFN
ncbi:MAG: hypothetical protein Q9178_007335 [Gyalolechia marmorata]